MTPLHQKIRAACEFDEELSREYADMVGEDGLLGKKEHAYANHLAGAHLANDHATEVITALLEANEEIEKALQRFQVYAMEGQVKCERHLPGHPIVGLCAEFEMLADAALAANRERLEGLLK